MASVGEWLNTIGLGQYAKAFGANDISWETLPSLDHELLKEIGINSVGHRIALLKAIDTLERDGADPTQHREGTGARPPGGEAERRQLTIMFADLAGSTELTQELDPEDLRKVNRAYQDACTAAVQAYGGFVARYMGDGVLAYFGYPQAHEDDAERAVRAGLRLIEDVRALEAEVELAVRVGVATGEVVVGDLIGEGASQESAVVGETPNLAARLQSSGARNDLIISERTHRLVSGFFDFEARGERTYKGLKAAVPTWRVIGERGTESRFEAQHARRLTPLIGRETELRFLLERWMQAKAAEGQVVLLSAEAGLGKSRLTEELRQRVEGDAHRVLRLQCSPHHTQSAFYPFVSALERDARFERDDTPEQKRTKLSSLIAEARREDVLPLFSALVSIPPEGAPVDLSQPRIHQQLLEAMASQIVAFAHTDSVLLIVEDVHWADASSLEALDIIIDELRRTRVLALVTYRPEFQPSWTDRAHVTVLSVTRLGQQQVKQVVEALATSIPQHVVETIVSRTDGIPLFIEELTQAVLEGGYLSGQDGGGAEFGIPETLQDSLVARLDRLGVAKEVAQLGAIIGRTFSERLLTTVQPVRSDVMEDALATLTQSGLVFRRQTLDGTVYEFKHALVQDAAASTLLRERRRTLHAKVGVVLEREFPETVESEPELLAQHFAEAGMAEKSLDYWQLAADRARRRSANREASEHYSRALSILVQMPEGAERLRREAALQAGLGMALTAAKGQTVPEVGIAFGRARDICEQLEDVDQLFGVLRGLWLHYQVGRKLKEAGEIGEQLLEIATAQRRTDYSLEAYRALGQNALWRGKFSRARECFQNVLDLYDPAEHGQNAHRFGQDPRVLAPTMLAVALWTLGYPDMARRHTEDGLLFADEAKHPYSRCVAGIMGMFTFSLLRDWENSALEAERTFSVAEEYGFPFFQAFTTGYSGLARVMQGDLGQGLATLERGFRMHKGPKEAWWFYAVGSAYVEAGHFDAAVPVLKEAFDMKRTTGDALIEPAFHVLNAEVLLHTRPGPADAEDALGRAIEIARTLGARSWQLRASTQLAGLWLDQGKGQEAKALLQPIYGSFTEGFETASLKEAKAILGSMD